MSLPKYPEYKDSGVDWLGKVPAHWQVRPLKSRYAVVGGSTPKSDVADYWDGDINWVTPADLSRLSGLEIRGSLRTITDEGLQSCGTSLVPSGSLILSTRAPIGSLGLATMELCTNQGCKSLVPRSGESSRFAAYALSVAGPALNVRGKGTTFLELSGDELASFRLAFPEREEQEAIATFLDHETAKVDALIAEQENLLALLAEKRQATISHAVTRGLDPNAPMKESGIPWLGEVPAHWEVRRLKDCLAIVKDVVGSNSKDYKLLSLTLQGVIPRDMDNPQGKFPAEFDTYQALKAGDLVFCLFDVEETPRAVGYSPLDGMVTGAYTVCRNRPDFVGEYLYYFYLSRDQYKAFKSFYTGLRNVIRKEAFLAIPCPVPPATEQTAIVDFLVDALARTDVLQAEVESALSVLKERRSALIAAAVTGQIDVRGAVEPEAA